MVGAFFASTPSHVAAAEPPPEVSFAVQSSSSAHDNTLASSTPEVSQKTAEVPVNNDRLAWNCYAYIKAMFVPNLPQTRYLKPNAEAQIGAVALFTYPSGLRHYAYVINRVGDLVTIAESNYRKGKYTTRTIPISSPSLDGFWMP